MVSQLLRQKFTKEREMESNGGTVRDIECALLWKLARTHGWSEDVSVPELAGEANVQDEQEAREVARNRLANRSYIGYHPGHDRIWLQAPPDDDVCYRLRDVCGFSELQIEATFDSYFDGF